MKKRNKYQNLFDPRRMNKKIFIGIFKSLKSSFKGYITGYKKKALKAKCPHMGCNLIYNEIEKTFDCPCHGSRFDLNGNPISAPANKKINLK